MRSFFRNLQNLLPLVAAQPFSSRTLNAVHYGGLVESFGIRSARSSAMPLYLQIEPTVRCNLSCLMCPSSIDRKRNQTEDLSYADFKRIINSIPSALHVHLQGFGEPLLNRDILRMISYCKSRSIRVTLVTNGQLLSDQMCRALAGSGLDAIGISMDGATKSKYEKIRKGASFGKLVSNIRSLAATRDSALSRMKIFLVFVMMKENISELPLVVDFASKAGLDGVRCQHVQFDREVKGNASRSVLSSHNRPMAEAQVSCASGLAKNSGLDCFIQGFEKSRSFICPWPWAGVYITCKGEVSPCCNVCCASFGNIMSQRIDAIYNSEEYKEFRKKHLRGCIPAVCKGCPQEYYNGEKVIL